MNRAIEGYHDRKQAQREETAAWVSLLLSAQTGTAINAAQLLGTEEEEKQTRIEDAQKSLVELELKMKEAGIST